MADDEPKVNGTSLIKSEAKDFSDFLIPLVFDTLKNLALLGALSAIFFAAEWLKTKGMEPEHVRQIELLHFWVSYGALIWIGLVFLVKLVARSFR
jgi:hypothetical protein